MPLLSQYEFRIKILFILYIFSSMQCSHKPKNYLAEGYYRIYDNSKRMILGLDRSMILLDSCTVKLYSDTKVDLTNIWHITRVKSNIYTIKNLISEKVFNFDLRNQITDCIPISNWFNSRNHNQEWELFFNPKREAYSLKCKYNNAQMYVNWVDSTLYSCIKPNTADTLFHLEKISFTDGYLSLLSRPQKITDYFDLIPEGTKISNNHGFMIERKRHVIRTDSVFFVDKKFNFDNLKIFYKIQNPINGALTSYIDNKMEINWSQSQHFNRRLFNAHYISNAPLLKCASHSDLNDGHSLDVDKYFNSINLKENHVYISLIELDSFHLYSLKPNHYCALNIYYPKKINIGKRTSFICHGNFTFNQIKHFCSYYFDKGFTSGSILNIDVDHLKRILKFDIINDDGSVTYNQSIAKLENLISSSQSRAISVELANTCDNSPLYKYGVADCVLNEFILDK